MAAKGKPNEIAITRLYDAPVKKVWDAWTDPKQAAKWWGPRGFTLTTHSKELRPGGMWHYTMHGPDGKDWINKTIYHEVEKHAKLVYDHGGNDEQAPLFRVTVTFQEIKGKTQMEMIMALATAEQAAETRKFIKAAGGNSTWDRLAEYLAEENEGKHRFVINRTFDAPLNLMFEMWTDPKHIARWMPPTGMTMEFLKSDIRPGGSSFYFMSGPGIDRMYGSAEYLEIQKPDRLLYTQEFRDEKGGISRHPFAPLWPESMLTTVELTAEGPDQTRVTVTWEPHGATTREELEVFLKERGGMTQGWTGSFDKLEDLLASR